MKGSQLAVGGIAAGCGCLILVVALGSVAIYKFFDVPTGAAIRVEAPLQATVGEPFTLVVTATNNSDSKMQLVDVDVASSYVQGIAIKASEPQFSDSSHIPIDETVSYSLDLPIPPRGSVTVRFEAVGVSTGDFSGDVDVCINGMASCLSQAVRTVVAE